MISIPVAVEEVVKKKPFLEGALVDGLINLSALARQIKPEVEERIGKTVNDSAVIMALNRLVPRLELMSAMKIKNVVENMGDIVVRSNLSDFTFLNTSTLYGLQARLLNEVHSLKNVFCTFSQGIYETTLVVSDSIVPLVKELFANERIISSNTNLSLITVRLPSENTACPGVYYYLFKELAWDNINIVEVISTANEFTIVVGDHDIHRAGTNQRFADFQGLLTGIGLGDQQLVNIYAQIFGVNGVQGMLHIDENGGAAALLGFGHHMQGHGGLTAGFRPVDLDDSAAGQAADAQCHIQRKGAGGDGFHIHGGILAQAHYSPFAKLLFDLADGGFQGFLLIAGGGGGFLCFFLDGHAISSQSDGILISLYTIFAGIARGKRKFVRGWGKNF